MDWIGYWRPHWNGYWRRHWSWSVGAATINALCELLTEAIFDLPKTAALDDAYKFLGLDHKATNDQINKRYRQLALIYHPDKEGGSEDKFIKLQSYVCIIRASRE